MLSMSISEQITDCEMELAMLEGEQEKLWVSEENGADVQAELTEIARRIRDVKRRLKELEERPDWNGWVYYYNEEIQTLSYDECNYEIDLTVKSAFLVGDHLQRVISKDWVTEEVFDGLVNALCALSNSPDARKDVCEKAAMCRHHRWGRKSTTDQMTFDWQNE